MKKLLIHNNNTCLVDPEYFSVNEQYVFDLTTLDGEIDSELHSNLVSGEIGRTIKKCDLLFIKLSLSSNYLEYLGLRLAYHIRLTKELGDKTRIPIIIIAEEDINFIGRTSNLGSLLLTKGTYLIKDNPHAYETILNDWKENLISSASEKKIFIDQIHLPKPANYSSHHNIDNELSLLMWSDSLGIIDQLDLSKLNFINTLYYKYIRGKSISPASEIFTENKSKSKGKVLLIDDDAIKGWYRFYNEFFNRYFPDVDLIDCDVKFENKNQLELIDMVDNKINKIKPDLVLLDLRLCEEDFDPKCKPENLSGFLVAEIVKKLNRGTQIIITTASNKIWNFSVFNKFGTINYLLKTYSLDLDKQFEDFSTFIENGLERSAFLKLVFSKLKYIKKQLKILKNKKEIIEDFRKKIENHLDTCFALLEKSLNEPGYRNHAYLQLYFILEDLTNCEAFFKEGEVCKVFISKTETVVVLRKKNEKEFESPIEWNKKKKKYIFSKSIYNTYNSRLEMNIKMQLIILFRYGGDSIAIKKWKDLNWIRNNKAGHSGDKDLVNKDDVELILEFIQFVFDSKNVNTKNKLKSLDASEDDKKKALLEKYNKKNH